MKPVRSNLGVVVNADTAVLEVFLALVNFSRSECTRKLGALSPPMADCGCSRYQVQLTQVQHQCRQQHGVPVRVVVSFVGEPRGREAKKPNFDILAK